MAITRDERDQLLGVQPTPATVPHRVEIVPEVADARPDWVTRELRLRERARRRRLAELEYRE